MRLLVAGLTGQLGSGIAAVASEVGVELIPVVRPFRRLDASARVRRTFPGDPALAAAAIDGDVIGPRWGLGDETLEQLAPEVDAVLNVAAETNWSAPMRRLLNINLLGAIQGYELARALSARHPRCAAYCHASSIFVAGGRTGSIPEVALDADRDRTPYERTKWLAERALLDPVRRRGGPALGIARIGGLLGDSATGATTKRNSLYLLADRWNELPGRILPIARRGRVDMLPRDVAGRLLLKFVQAVVRLASPTPQLVHVCAGEAAPTTELLLAALDAIDGHGKVARPRSLRVPAGALLWLSGNAERFYELPPAWRNAVVGLRYMALDRVFERARLLRMVGGPLPAPSAETIARLAYGLPSAEPPRWELARPLARFAP